MVNNWSYSCIEGSGGTWAEQPQATPSIYQLGLSSFCHRVWLGPHWPVETACRHLGFAIRALRAWIDGTFHIACIPWSFFFNSLTIPGHWYNDLVRASVLVSLTWARCRLSLMWAWAHSGTIICPMYNIRFGMSGSMAMKAQDSL